MGTVLKLQCQLRKLYKRQETYSVPEPWFELAPRFLLPGCTLRLENLFWSGEELLEAQLCFGCLA